MASKESKVSQGATELREKVEALNCIDSTSAFAVKVPHDPGFARQYFTKDEAERRRDLQLSLAGDVAQKAGRGVQALVSPTEEDVNILVRRQAELDLYQFENWLASIYDPRDPNMGRLINDMYPEYYQKRLEQIDMDAELQKRAAKLSLLGPQSKDDLWLLYNIHMRRVVIPDHALHIPDLTRKGDVRRGLFNVKRFIGTTMAGVNQGGNIRDPAWIGWDVRNGGAGTTFPEQWQRQNQAANLGGNFAAANPPRFGAFNAPFIGGGAPAAVAGDLPANVQSFLRFPS